MSNAFIQAAIILFREGLEATLVIAALASYLRKADGGHRLKALYLGALAAVGVSLVAAWLFVLLNSGVHSELIEGIVILVAAMLMLYVSGWLLNRQDPTGWEEYLAGKADRALARGTGWAVGLLAFLAVFRESAETVLFVTALAATEGWNAGLFGGLAAAALALAVMFYFIDWATQRIPLRPLFVVTSAFLFLMGIRFIGEAILEFQGQAIVSFTPLNGFGWMETIGLNPTLEAVSAQLLVMLCAVVSFAIVQRNNRLVRRDRAARAA